MASEDAANAAGRVELKSLIESTSPAILQNALLTALPGTTDAQLKMLSEILSPLAATAAATKHCVRCHKTYHENQNHSGVCTIKHNDEGVEGERDDDDIDLVLHTLTCCDLVFDPDDEGHPEGFCIVKPHTTNPKEVVYYDDFDGEGNMNVLTCKEKGCLKKRKRKASRAAKPSKKTKASV